MKRAVIVGVSFSLLLSLQCAANSDNREQYISQMKQELEQLDAIGAAQEPMERQRLIQDFRHSMEELLRLMRVEMAQPHVTPPAEMTF